MDRSASAQKTGIVARLWQSPAMLGMIVGVCILLLFARSIGNGTSAVLEKANMLTAQAEVVFGVISGHWYYAWTFPNRFRVHDGALVFDWSMKLETTYIFSQIGLPDNCLCIEAGAANGITGSICQMYGQMGCMVHFVEPEPANIEHIKKNNQLEYRLFEGVLCDAPGTLTFRSDPGSYKRSGSLVGSEDRSREDYLKESVELRVKCFTLQDVIPPGYNAILSLDLEGYEEKVISTIPALKNKPVALMYEYTRIEKFLDVPGYRQVKILDNNVILLNDAGMELRANLKKMNNQGPRLP